MRQVYIIAALIGIGLLSGCGSPPAEIAGTDQTPVRPTAVVVTESGIGQSAIQATSVAVPSPTSMPPTQTLAPTDVPPTPTLAPTDLPPTPVPVAVTSQPVPKGHDIIVIDAPRPN